MPKSIINPEQQRLQEQYSGGKKWLKWGPYLSERQWGTVREDYSEHGTAWDFFPHDHARSRVYRWGEDGIAGICDELCNLCFGLSLWNGKDSILKERLFGLTGPEGNHGEDVKELYYYLDSTPTHSYMKHLYKYTLEAFPYQDLVDVNRQRSKEEAEFELYDSAAFDEMCYYDVYTEYAKADTDDICIRITAHVRGRKAGKLSILPTLWFRNRWSFGLLHEKPSIQTGEMPNQVQAIHPHLGEYYLYFDQPQQQLFTENETNNERLFGTPNANPFVKDAFHRAVIQNDYGFLSGQKNKGNESIILCEQQICKETRVHK